MITIEGRNPVLEALRANSDIKSIFIKLNIETNDKIAEIILLAHQKNIPVKFKSKVFLDKLSQTKIHQGVIAFKSSNNAIIGFQELINKHKNKPKLFVYIRESQNEYNVGSIIRSIECAGGLGIILPPKTELTSQMIRASMGASEHIDIINENLFNCIKTAKLNNILVVGIEVRTETNYFEQDLTQDMLLIIGGEDRSLSDEIMNKCDSVVRIPMLGKLNSLNMSIATSIVLFDRLRQNNIK
jgi:23S rRNA (guanosine2251-2'-O)-methyltransferase